MNDPVAFRYQLGMLGLDLLSCRKQLTLLVNAFLLICALPSPACNLLVINFYGQAQHSSYCNLYHAARPSNKLFATYSVVVLLLFVTCTLQDQYISILLTNCKAVKALNKVVSDVHVLKKYLSQKLD